MSEKGRPPKYDPAFAVQAAKLCQIGATDIEIADFFGVTVRTLYRWKGLYDDFCQALRAGKSLADDRVERSLYQRAVGYEFESEKVFSYKGQIVRAATREHVPPDPGAAMSWLKNRRKNEWRDVQHHTHEFSELTDQEVRGRYEELKQKALAEGGKGQVIEGTARKV